MLRKLFHIILFSSFCSISKAEFQQSFVFFYGDTINISIDSSLFVNFQKPITEPNIKDFYKQLDNESMQSIVAVIQEYKKKNELDDWIYYQLIRATAERLSPKAANYERYTLYKWFLLLKSGYASLLTITPDKMLLFIQNNEEVFEIPTRIYNNTQFVCLNYHDYGSIDFNMIKFSPVDPNLFLNAANTAGASSPGKSFSYVIHKLPDFNSRRYLTKEIDFDYYQRDYRFRILVNPDIQKIFANYPVLNYSYYFNMPMSRVTYGSLIPELKQQLARMDVKRGVDYLMHFVRYAFQYQPDSAQFGKEKRLSAEQTLLYERSDCEDRSAFFFYVVKEIYNLPMIVLSYPKHVTVAVDFNKKIPGGYSIKYKDRDYYICEPSSQSTDLRIGGIKSDWRKESYDVVYEYAGKTK